MIKPKLSRDMRGIIYLKESLPHAYPSNLHNSLHIHEIDANRIPIAKKKRLENEHRCARLWVEANVLLS